MPEVKHITVEFSESGLFASSEMAGVDVPASMDRFAEALTKRLGDRYPGAEVEVKRGIHDRHSVADDVDHYDTDDVGELVHDVWEPFDWVVYLPVTAAQLIRPYYGPQWVVEPQGEASDEDDLAAINKHGFVVRESDCAGWGPYTHVIQVGEVYYLARLGAPEA